MSRLSNQLEKCFRLLNDHFFNGCLEMPIITIAPTRSAYGHYTAYDAWQSKDEGKREINIASATLDRPLEEVVATLLHEMVHYYDDCILLEVDCTRNGTYHNATFYKTAVTHGLNCEKIAPYGYCRTSPSDELLEFLLDHDEIREIEMCRVDEATALSIGRGSGTGSEPPTTITRRINSRRWTCPSCGTIIRSTKPVNVICGDCLERFLETT